MLVFFVALAAVVYFCGLGWTGPSAFLAFLKSVVFPKEKHTGLSELTFLIDWAVIQLFMGLATIIGFILAFMWYDTFFVFRCLSFYVLFSGVSGVAAWFLLFGVHTSENPRL